MFFVVEGAKEAAITSRYITHSFTVTINRSVVLSNKEVLLKVQNLLLSSLILPGKIHRRAYNYLQQKSINWKILDCNSAYFGTLSWFFQCSNCTIQLPIFGIRRIDCKLYAWLPVILECIFRATKNTLSKEQRFGFPLPSIC